MTEIIGEMNIQLRQLYVFTDIRVEDCRRLARHGRKDEAREFLKYVRNASIISLLKQFEPTGTPFDIDVPHLEWKLRELENECHPQAVSDHKDDFALIRSMLESLAVGLHLLTESKKTAPR